MPAASSSRKRASRARREPSDDRIEEGDPTQRNNDDVVNGDGSEDEQPARRMKKGRGQAVQRDPDPVDQSDDENGIIDLENFCDQPLDRKESTKLHGIAQDWEMIRKQIHQSSFSLVKNIAMSLADVMEVDQSTQALDEVDAIMRDLLDIDKEMISHEQTLKELHQKLLLEERVEDVMNKYEKAVKEDMDQYRSRTSRQKYGSSEVYTQFKQGIFEVQNPGIGIPPINEFIPREEGDASDDEDDLEVGGITQDYKCPLTLTTLVNPMTSKICGHSFSEAAIREFLKNPKAGGTPCPAAGCTKRLTMAVIQPDKDLEKKVKIAARKRQRQEEDSDDGEVIE
ncbi:hypothetical protein ID866_3028 [Astraeus odoratus]|nr:hypothetical protein ID866_3028 [Astraeus odoratus]